MKRISLLLVILSLTVFCAAPVFADCDIAPIHKDDACTPPPFLPIIKGFIPFDFKTYIDASVECGPIPPECVTAASSTACTDSSWYKAATHDIVIEAVTYAHKTRTDIMFSSKAHVEQDVSPPFPAINPITGKAVTCRCVIGTGNGPDSLIDMFYEPQTPRVPCYNIDIDVALAQTHGNPEMTSCNYNCEVNPWSLTTGPPSPDYLKYPLCDTNADGTQRLGIFTLSFPMPTDRFLIFERGMDSDIHVHALDSKDAVIASADIPRPSIDLSPTPLEKYAGFNIRVDTGIPGFVVGPQPVGTVGLQLPKGVLSDKLRVTIIPRTDFGADLKIMALAPEYIDQEVALVPCPINYPAGSPQPPGGGFVIFNNSNGVDHNLELTASLTKIAPNTEYDLYLYVDNNDSPYEKLGTVMTNKAGNATFHQNLLLPVIPQGQTRYLSFNVTKKGSGRDIYETPGIHDAKGTVLYFSGSK